MESRHWERVSEPPETVGISGNRRERALAQPSRMGTIGNGSGGLAIQKVEGSVPSSGSKGPGDGAFRVPRFRRCASRWGLECRDPVRRTGGRRLGQRNLEEPPVEVLTDVVVLASPEDRISQIRSVWEPDRRRVAELRVNRPAGRKRYAVG